MSLKTETEKKAATLGHKLGEWDKGYFSEVTGASCSKCGRGVFINPRGVVGMRYAGGSALHNFCGGEKGAN